MNDKKQVFLSLETARKMYNKVRSVEDGYLPDNPTILFLLDNFTKEELEAKELPKSWEELQIVKGYYVNSNSEILIACECETVNGNKSIFPTKELAEASLALSQLLQLRDVYNGDWKVDLNNRPTETRFIIRNYCNIIDTLMIKNCINSVLSFQKESIRDEFVRNFSELITTALPLL